LIEASDLERAMLFELAVAAGEQLMSGNASVDWDTCLRAAVARQRRHFDAKFPDQLSSWDRDVALMVATNLVALLDEVSAESGGARVTRSPVVPGFQWIRTGVGDFSVGRWLIEVKCTHKHFSSSDYRQILMYWLLGYAASIERGMVEWSHVVLLNPRLNLMLRLSFSEIVSATSAGKSKVELLELFSSMVGVRELHVTPT
jgi:hypothetical protein